MWGKRNGPYMQILHFAFGIGAFLAPLLARPFLSPDAVALAHNTTIVEGNIPVSPHLHNPWSLLNRSHRTRRDFDDELVSLLDEATDMFRYKRSSLVIHEIPTNTLTVNSVPFAFKHTLSDRVKRNDDTKEQIQFNKGSLIGSSVLKEVKVKKRDDAAIGTSTDSGGIRNQTATPLEDEKAENVLPPENQNNATATKDEATYANGTDTVETNGTKTTETDKVVTTITTTTSTFLPVGPKPGAATDHNRDKTTADGNQVKDHLNSAAKAKESDNGGDANPGDDDKTDETKLDTTESTQSQVNKTDIDRNINNSTNNGSAERSSTASSESSTQSLPYKESSAQHSSAPSSKVTTVAPKPSITTKKATTTTTTTPTTTTTTNTPTTTTTTTTTPTTTTPTTTTTTTPTTPKPAVTTKKDTDNSGKDSNTSPKTPKATDAPDSNNPTGSEAPGGSFTKPETAIDATDADNTTEIKPKPKTAVDTFIHAVKNMSRVQFAYVIIGVCLLLNSLLFLVLYCKDKNGFSSECDIEGYSHFHGIRVFYKGTLICFLGLFFFCYVGLEVTYGALVTTFAVDQIHWTKDEGATVAAIFWGSLATGRGVAILIANCCGPTVMLVIDLIFMLAGGLILSFGVILNDNLIYLGTVILGLGMSSVFPAGISWADKYFRVSGKSTAVFVIGSAAGQMVVPSVIGYFFDNDSAMVLMYTTAGLSGAACLIFVVMQCLAIKMSKQVTIKDRNGFLPLEDEDEETVEMDLVHFDKSKTQGWRQDKRAGGEVQYHTLISDLEDD